MTEEQIKFIDELYGRGFRLKVESYLRHGHGWSIADAIHYTEHGMAFSQNPELPKGFPE